jgi:uncharacterized protein
MRKRLAALVVLACAGSALAQEPPACTGKNLLDELQARDPAKYEAVMAESRTVPNGEAVLWKIERDGLPVSYLLGTAHVTDPRVTKGPPGVEDLIAGSRKVALEVKELADDQEMAMAVMRSAPLMVMPVGKTLWDVVPDADEAAVRNSPNLPAGGADAIYGYKPWVVATMLTLPPCEQAREASGMKSFDELIARFANRKGVEVVGLETLAEQFAVLSGMDMDLQVRYLVETARMSDRAADNLETLLALYDRRQLTALMPLMMALEEPSETTKAVYAYVESDLIRKRNRLMVKRAGDLLAKGNVFIAVGALHLPGDEGLVELIRKAGYKVTAVN